MSQLNVGKDFDAFYQRVLQDPTLQATLIPLTERDEFMRRVVTLGQALGYDFTIEQVMAAWQAQRRAWLERWIR